MENGQAYRHPRRRRRRRRSLPGRIGMALLVIGVLAVGISVFFRVSQVEISGAVRYNREEIMEAAALDYGNHLLLINVGAMERRLWSNLPYVDSAAIRRRFPNVVEIVISESIPLAALATDMGYLILDRQGKVLELAERLPDENLIRLAGFDVPILPRAGEIVSFGDTGRESLAYLQDILAQLLERGIAEGMQEIDMTRSDNPQLVYEGRFTINLGPNRDLPHKMQMLAGIIDSLSDYERGFIDLTLQDPVFRPE